MQAAKKNSRFEIAAAVALLAAFAWFMVSRESGPAPAATATPAAAPAADAGTDSALVGALRLRESMRDPASLSLETVVLPDGGGVACFAYRSRNGFGGMEIGRAVYTSDGKFKTNESDGFYKLWNATCEHKKGREVAEVVKYRMTH